MLTAQTLFSADFRDAIAGLLGSFLDDEAARLVSVDPALEPVLALERAFTAGGKRLRPAACVAGWLCVAGEVPDELAEPLLRAAASLDLLHVSALVHDDVMDDSDTRRGLPATHIALATQHRESHARGDAEAFGRAGAILVGDMLLVHSAQMFDACGLPSASLDQARPYVAAVRSEVTAGQFLDVLAATADPAAPDALESARRVVEYKTSRYTVIRPTQIGAALAGASPEILDALTDIGSAIGRAFQLRDDVLGIFGDAALLGKPTGDDIREGKRTVLVAHAFARADEAGRTRLSQILGDATADDAAIAEACEIIVASGALAHVEADIESDRHEALTLIEQAPFHPAGKEALTALVAAAVDRQQ